MVAVTPTKVHLLSVHSTYLLHVRAPEPFAVIDRRNCRVSKGGATAAWWTLTDTVSGREYRLECSRVGTLAHGNEVMELLVSDAPAR
jgi:hypothetical protein